jgi:pyrroline-5-carboxylate reductase
MTVGLIGAGNMARAMVRGWGGPVLCSDAGSGAPTSSRRN